MAERYFTPAEVEALIPALTRIMERIVTAHRHLESLREETREAQHRLALQGGAVPDIPAWQARRTRMDALTGQVQEALGGLDKLGGVPKDLAMGLVDFPHLRNGRVVNLCWKLGEHDVRFWHGLDEGFAARKPL